MALKLRKPTGLVPYPFILIEGEEKSGKTYAAAHLAASGKCGDVYWLDIGEADADRYGVMADYMVIDHDGTYGDILEQVKEVVKLPHEKGGKPSVLIVDGLSGLWSLIVDRAQNSADRRGGKGRITMDLWNKAKREWRAVVDELIRYEGIVVATARGKDVALVENGKPVSGRRSWSVEAEKSLPYDVDAWVRVTRGAPPTMIGLRSLKVKLRPGVDRPMTVKDFTLKKLVWEILGVGKDTGKRSLPDAPQEPLAGDSPADEWHDLNNKIHATLTEMGITPDDIEKFQSYIAEKVGAESWDDATLVHLKMVIKRIDDGGIDWVGECVMEMTSTEPVV